MAGNPHGVRPLCGSRSNPLSQLAIDQILPCREPTSVAPGRMLSVRAAARRARTRPASCHRLAGSEMFSVGGRNMSALEISNQELSRLADEAMGLAKSYWASLEERRAFPVTGGEQTTKLFSRPWPETGLGRAVLREFETIAEHSR